MSTSFVRTFEEARGEISLHKLAQAMASRTGKNARGLSGNLYRLLNGGQTPKKETVVEIAETLGSLRKLSTNERSQLQDRLMNSAHPQDLRTVEKIEVSESEERRRLWRRCEKALHKVHGLSRKQIETILDHAGVATMKLIIAADEKGEEIEVIPLQRISAEFEQTSSRSSGDSTSMKATRADNVIDAGRARILIEGDISPEQMQVLRNAAEMIASVLKL